ncbi:hypothetical protein G7Y89_g1252 [Cudoniella acicularis]|uniref:2EXR domain-containing protein n=1 Tax=Cudoniella acicularis TaxID=354080 RepID=A0A8H4W7L2_9HELO|nr:hypothetical protein G7Y89_g1252 [Cudoniella acicularis]
MYRPKTFDPPWIDYFTRPCPYYVKNYLSFPKFPLLPKELQLLIWEEAAEPESRIIKVVKKFDYIAPEPSYEDDVLIAHYKVPGMFRASYDARRVISKRYNWAFYKEFFYPIHINFNMDVLQMRAEDLDDLILDLGGFDHRARQKVPAYSKKAAKLSYLALEGFAKLSGYFDLLTLACMYFSKLKHIFLAFTGGMYQWDPLSAGSHCPVTKNPDEIAFFWSGVEGKIKKSPLLKGRYRLDKWKPPILTFGHQDQWRRAKFPDKTTMEWDSTQTVEL